MDMIQRITNIVVQVSDLPQKDQDSIYEYLDHDEWGVALETLCAAVYEEKLHISQAVYEVIRDAGEEMEMEPAIWENLRPLIKSL